jgi:tripartite-type tricarboxylate transporter receptor subunit TctC
LPAVGRVIGKTLRTCATHIAEAERFLASAGVQAVRVPFKGGAEAMTEVMAGRIDFFFGPVGLVLPSVKDGKLIALGVNTTARSTALPQVPTLAEAGFANTEFPFWIGLFLPAKTPRQIVERLHAETLKAMQEPRVRDKLATLGADPIVMSPGEFDGYLKKAMDSDLALVKTIGLQLPQ